MVDTDRQNNPSACVHITISDFDCFPEKTFGKTNSNAVQRELFVVGTLKLSLSKEKRFYQQTMSSLYFQSNGKDMQT